MFSLNKQRTKSKMLTIAYIRVSTEDQVDYSPDAQRNRCVQHAISHNLGPVTFLSDEGRSGKDLDRPAMAELMRLVESGEVSNVIVWKLDRLTRDVADQSRLIKLFKQHAVALHSVIGGRVDINSASGRMQAGIHGVIDQYYREGLVENVLMGNHEAIVEKGRWLNRAPTGYDMINGELHRWHGRHLAAKALKAHVRARHLLHKLQLMLRVKLRKSQALKI